MNRVLCRLVRVCTILIGLKSAFAQATRPDTVIGPLKDGWESIDQRLVFLTVRLSSVEASIGGVNKAIADAGWQKDKKLAAATQAEQANDAMDQNGGGPVPWQQFYGTTAAQFFYHPTDDRTIHVNPMPVDQRPPQLDYIYRANSNAQERAREQANDIGKKIDELLNRRRHLEEQQSALWCRISFRAIATRNIPLKLLLRYDVTKGSSDSTDLQRVEAIRAGAIFVRTVDQLMAQAQRVVEAHQSAVVDNLQKGIDTAHAELLTKLQAQQLLASDLSDSSTTLGKFAAAAQHLDDTSENIAEAYTAIQDGNRSGDDQEIKTFRRELQQSYFDLAASQYTTEECLEAAAAEWKVIPDTTRQGPPINADLRVNGNAKDDSSMGSGHNPIEAANKDASLESAADTGGSDPEVRVEGAWTILFRSSDPLLFNTPVLNATSYSVSVSNAPPATKWLRLKRTDTGDYVIIRMTANGIVSNGDMSQHFWWRGDKRLNHQACSVGIIDQSVPATGATLQVLEPSGNFAGWGFGEMINGEQQEYVWAGVTIPRTVFEIAVTDQELSPEDQGQVLK
jgi:hypothetical protein